MNHTYAVPHLHFSMATPNCPMLEYPRVLVTPHSAWYTEEAMRDLQRLLAEDIARVLAGESPRCPVTTPSAAGAGRLGAPHG
jgi:phosphoglycerate dehydrogenase-like enzyme